MTQIIDPQGRAQEVDLSLSDYQEAYAQNLTLPQLLARKYPTDASAYGTAFEQCMASNGLFLHADQSTGYKPPSIRSVLDGSTNINMGPITRPDGNGAQSLTGRLLFPAMLLEMVESELARDTSSYEGVFNQMVATTTPSDSPRVDQPIINLTAPRAVKSQPVAQLSEPPSMVSITLSEKSYRLPTVALGIEISNEAQAASTLDLVGIALREQALAERARIVDGAIKAMVDGDTDLGMAAIGSQTAQSYDAAITTAGNITNKAWIKWLRSDWQRMTIDWVMCDLDTYLALESRAGRPTVNDDNGTAKLTSLPSLALPGIPNQVRVFPVETSLLGTNVMVGIDSSKAIRRVTYAGATYQAVEEFVLRKSTAMRFDYSLNYFRLIDGGWKKLTLTV